uniref:HSF-type DNA-binding domain-containing protein n=1 Tax=Amphilophus citrinellus TaxID=61819 RepID=A0A3Q0SBP4_AMPCI
MQESPGAVGVDGSYTSNVPAFLTKLWTLVEDPDTNHLICWSAVSLFSDQTLHDIVRCMNTG